VKGFASREVIVLVTKKKGCSQRVAARKRSEDRERGKKEKTRLEACFREFKCQKKKAGKLEANRKSGKKRKKKKSLQRFIRQQSSIGKGRRRRQRLIGFHRPGVEKKEKRKTSTPLTLQGAGHPRRARKKKKKGGKEEKEID